MAPTPMRMRGKLSPPSRAMMLFRPLWPPAEPEGRMRLPFDKRKLAAHLGTTPENLSRTFATLAAHGVDAHGREIVVTDMIALKELARPDPLIDDPLA